MAPTQGDEYRMGSRPGEPPRFPRLRDSVAFLAPRFAADNVPKHRRVVVNYDTHAGRPPDMVGYALARKHRIKVVDAYPVGDGRWSCVPLVRPVSDRRPRERSVRRPREQRHSRSRATRAGPSEDDPELPAASPFQAAWRSALHLTASELETLVSHARIRAAWMGRWV